MDLVMVVGTLPLWLPLMAIIALAIKITSRGKVLFAQKRYGINKTFFTMYKFRTMYTNAPADTPTHLLSNPTVFITPIGRILRKTSLDELPQIINVLLSQLSLVGPRPALWNQDDLIAERDKYGANNIKPGITGWAQINGRDELPIEVKARLDGEYTEHLSLLMDISCLVGTIKGVLGAKGVSH
jgi:O-antigen biosynthesis protein WbqP